MSSQLHTLEKAHGRIVFQEPQEQVKIDQKDRKILRVLAENSRTSFTALGRMVGLSQENVLYRVKRLQQQHLIVDFFTAIDSRRLGILSFVVFIKFSKILRAKQETLITSLLKNKHISWVTTTAGQFDLMIFLQAMSVYEFEKEWQNIIKEHGHNFREMDMGIMTEYGHCPAYYPVADLKGFAVKQQLFPYEKEFKEAVKSPLRAEFDAKDLLILRNLLVNSRIKLTDLGKEIGMSSQNVNFRIQRMVQQGIIACFGYRPNYQKLRYQYYTTRLKVGAVDQAKLEKLKQFVLSLPQTFYYFRMLGHWTFSFHMFYTDVRQLNAFLAELREQFGEIIESYDSTVHLDQYYYTYLSPSSYESLLHRLADHDK